MDSSASVIQLRLEDPWEPVGIMIAHIGKKSVKLKVIEEAWQRPVQIKA